MLGRMDAFDDVRVEVGEHAVSARLAVPQGPVGVVIFATCATHSARDQYVAEALRARGLATVECELLSETENRFRKPPEQDVAEIVRAARERFEARRAMRAG